MTLRAMFRRDQHEPAPDTMPAHQAFLDDALAIYGNMNRHSSLANAIAIWSVRKMGGEKASTFADAIVRGVQFARRGSQ